MAELVYTIKGDNTGLANAINGSISLVAKLQAAIDRLNATSFEGLASSLNNLGGALSGVTEGLAKASTGAGNLTQNFTILNQTSNTLNQTVNTLNADTNTLNQTFNSGIQSSNAARLGLSGLTSSYLGLFAAVGVVKQIVSSNAEISDSLADVRRTASLTAEETENLFKSLEKIDTRTSLKGLIDISTIGGQLGISKDQLSGFTKATDLLNVALGGEIKGGPEQIAKGLGILNNVFKVSDKEGGNVEKSFNQIGSAILGLGQSGLATGDFLVNFGEKVGGVAAQAKLSIPILLSYGAVLQEQGVKSDVAGTAFKKLIGSLGTKTDKFLAVAQIADSSLTLKQFTDLINNNTQQALELFFEGLRKGGPTTVSFSNLLKSVGLDASRSGQAISAIALNLDDLHTHIEQSTTDFNSGSKAAEQAALKNDTLGASVDRLSKAFVTATTSGAISGFFKAIIDGVTKSIKGLDTFAGSISRLFSNKNNLGAFANITSSEQSLQQIDDLQGAFKSSSSTKDAFLQKNPLTGNGELPTLKGQSRQELTDQLHQIQAAYQNAYHAYSVYFDGIRSGVLTDSDEGIGRISKVKQNAQDILYIYNKVKETLDALPIPKQGEPVTLPGKGKKGTSSGISQDEFLNSLQSFGDRTDASANQSGLSGLDLTLQKIEGKYKKHYDALDGLRIQLDKSNKISDTQRANDESALADQENTLSLNKAKEISDAKINEAARVANEITRINNEFGIKSEQSRAKELAQIEARYDAEVRKAKGNAEILKALDADKLQAIQAVNDKYKAIQDDLYTKIGFIEDTAIAATKGKLESETDRIAVEWEKRKKAADDYYESLKKIAAAEPNNTSDALPGLSNAFASLNLQRQQVTTGRLLDQGQIADTTAANVKDFNSSLSSGLRDATRGIFDYFTTLNQQADHTFGSIFSDLVSKLTSSLNNIFLNVLEKGLATSLENGIKNGTSSLIGANGKLTTGGLVAAGAGILGGIVSGSTSKTSATGQGLGGALSGAATGALIGSIVPGVGTVVGGVVGGVVGLLGGIFGASKAQKALQEQQLAEQQQQTALLKSSLAYTSQIIGRDTSNGIVTGIQVGAFGQLVATVSGKDLQFVLDRNSNGR